MDVPKKPYIITSVDKLRFYAESLLERCSRLTLQLEFLKHILSHSLNHVLLYASEISKIQEVNTKLQQYIGWIYSKYDFRYNDDDISYLEHSNRLHLLELQQRYLASQNPVADCESAIEYVLTFNYRQYGKNIQEFKPDDYNDTADTFNDAEGLLTLVKNLHAAIEGALANIIQENNGSAIPQDTLLNELFTRSCTM